MVSFHCIRSRHPAMSSIFPAKHKTRKAWCTPPEALAAPKQSLAAAAVSGVQSVLVPQQWIWRSTRFHASHMGLGYLALLTDPCCHFCVSLYSEGCLTTSHSLVPFASCTQSASVWSPHHLDPAGCISAMQWCSNARKKPVWKSILNLHC